MAVTTGITGTSYTITGLTPRGRYRARIQGVKNSENGPWSGWVTFQQDGPLTPSPELAPSTSLVPRG